MSINAFFFAEGQQLEEEEEEGVKLLMKLLDKQDGQNEVVHIIRCCQMFARVCFGLVLCKKRRPNVILGCNLKPLILSPQLWAFSRNLFRNPIKT